MGDRGNIVVKEDNENPIYLYTHWGGYKIKDILKNALSRKLSWNDGPYLTRIIFCEMIKKDVNGETGFGIVPYMCDNEYNLLWVYPDKGLVIEKEERTEKEVNRWTFEEFIKADFEKEDN